MQVKALSMQNQQTSEQYIRVRLWVFGVVAIFIELNAGAYEMQIFFKVR